MVAVPISPENPGLFSVRAVGVPLRGVSRPFRHPVEKGCLKLGGEKVYLATTTVEKSGRVGPPVLFFPTPESRCEGFRGGFVGTRANETKAVRVGLRFN